MTPLLLSALMLLVLLQVKHLFGDFFLQTPRMLSGRAEYMHFGRLQHAGVHTALSVVALLLVGAPLYFIFWLCLAEGIIHFHIDFLKGRYSENTGHGPEKAQYWRAFGVDQLLHQLTYVAMLYFWAIYAA